MADYRNPTPDTPRNRGDFDAPHMTPVTPAEDLRTIMINRISWGAVASGVAMALVLQLIFNLLGIGIGITTADLGNTTATATPENISLGTLAYLGATGVVAALAGGYTAGRMAGETRESTAAWHGLISWAASVVVVTVLVAAGAGLLIGGTLNSTGFKPSYNNSSVYGNTGGGAITAYPDDMGNTTITTATPGGNRVTVDAATISRGALISSVALVLGALAAWFGGMMGVVQPTITTDRLRRRNNLH